VEFALVLVIFLMLIFALTEFGRVFHAYLVITNASREGARVAIVGADDTAIRTKVKNAAASLNPALTDSNITITPAPAARTHGAEVNVQVNYSVTLLVDLNGLAKLMGSSTSIVPNPFPLTAVTTMRVE